MSDHDRPRRPRGNWSIEARDGSRYWISWGPVAARPDMTTKAMILVPVPDDQQTDELMRGAWQEPQQSLTERDYLNIIDGLALMLAPMVPTNRRGSTPNPLPSALFWAQVPPVRIIEAMGQIPTTIAGPWEQNPYGQQWTRRHFSIQASQYRSFCFDYYDWSIVLRDRDDRHDEMPPRYYCYRDHHAVEGIGPFDDLAAAQRACDADAAARGWLLVDEEPCLPKYPPPISPTR